MTEKHKHASSCGASSSLCARLLPPVNQLTLKKCAPLLQLQHASNIAAICFIYNPNEKWEICLPSGATQIPVPPPSPRLEGDRNRQRGANGGICNGKPTGTVNHIISHQVPLRRVSLFTAMRPFASLSAGLISELVPR